MAILRSMDGKFYNVPDEQLEEHLVPPEEVKQKLGAALSEGPPGPGPGGPGGPNMAPGGVTIQVFPNAGPGGAPSQGDGEASEEEGYVQAHGHPCWRNCWRNCWRRNCWRNCWRNYCR